MGEVLVVGTLVSGEQRVCCGLSVCWPKPALSLVQPLPALPSHWTKANINRSGLGKPTSYKCGVKCRVEKSIARQKVIGPNKKISLRDWSFSCLRWNWLCYSCLRWNCLWHLTLSNRHFGARSFCQYYENNNFDFKNWYLTMSVKIILWW